MSYSLIQFVQESKTRSLITPLVTKSIREKKTEVDVSRPIDRSVIPSKTYSEERHALIIGDVLWSGAHRHHDFFGRPLTNTSTFHSQTPLPQIRENVFVYTRQTLRYVTDQYSCHDIRFDKVFREGHVTLIPTNPQTLLEISTVVDNEHL